MLRKPLLGLALAFLAAPVLGQNLDEIIAKNMKARGGLDKLKAVKSIRMTGKMTVAPGVEAPFLIEMRRPKSMRLEITLQGMTMIQAYDGTAGWAVMPMLGKNDPEPMPAEERAQAEEQADFDGPLVDWKEKGHKVELVGKEKVGGADAYKVKVTLKSGDVRYFFVAADSFLEIRAEGKRSARGQEIEFENSLGDYKDVGGLMIAHSLEMGPKGAPQKAKMVLEKVELNPALEDARFKMPPKAASPEAPKK